MKFSIGALFLFFCVLSISLYADAEVRDPSTGETFPSEVTFEHAGKEYHLQATGVSTRKKFFVKVYSVAHYLEQGGDNAKGDKFQQILQDDKAKQLTLKWLRNVNKGKVQEGYQESFKNTLSGTQYLQLQKEITTYTNFFNQDVQKGEEQILRWLPGGEIEVIINGNKAGSITNQEFAKALWNIWFGSKSVVDRNNLVSLMK